MLRHLRAVLLVSCLTLLVFAGSVQALVVAPAPVPDRVALADLVVVGKITAIEQKTVKAGRYPGDPNKAEYHIALPVRRTAPSGSRRRADQGGGPERCKLQ